MRKSLSLAVLLVVMLACALPSTPTVAPLPTFDSNLLGTTIAQTAAVAQTQTALKEPTATFTPKPTYTPSITPTFTPTFLWALPTNTPIPTFTSPPVIGGTISVEEENEEEEKKKGYEDPRKMSGKDWSCVWYGVTPPRNTVFKPQTRFTVQWMLFNSGNKGWPYHSVDFVYSSGYRHEETKIQDFPKSIGPGGEIWVRASFITPKKAGEYQTFFYLTVGNRKFCPVAYYFTVEE